MVYYNEDGIPVSGFYRSLHDIDDYFSLDDAEDKLENISEDGEVFSPSVVHTDELSGSWDHLLTSVNEIEDIDNIVSEGDTVRIIRPDTPYVLDRQPTLDTSHVTIEFESRFAKDGRPILRIQAENPIRGLEVGFVNPVEDIHIKNYGYDGNAPNQTHGTPDRDALLFDQVTDFTVENFYATETYPYHEHNTGGSSITTTPNCSDFRIENARAHNIGDRHLEISGTNGTLINIHNSLGYDRTINFGDGAAHHRVYGVHASECADTSMIGFPFAENPAYDIGIYNASWYNLPRGLANIGGVEDLVIDGVRGYNDISNSRTGVSYQFFFRAHEHVVNAHISDVCCHSTGDLDRPLSFGEETPASGTTFENITISDVNVRVDGAAYRSVNVLRDGVTFSNLNVLTPGTTPGGAAFYVEAPVTVRGGTLIGGDHQIQVEGAADARFYGVEFEDADPPIDVFDNGTRTIINGEAVESTGADTPQESYPQGTFVDFTDTTDGTGTGYYRVKRDGSFVKVA